MKFRTLITIMLAAFALTGCRSDRLAVRVEFQQRLIDSLFDEIGRRDAEIAVLNVKLNDLESAAALAQRDTLMVDTLEVAAKADTIPAVRRRDAEAEADILLLGTAYYVVGSKAELINKGVIGRTFPLFGRLYVNPSRRLDSTFRRVDTDKNVTFAVNHIGAKLISEHPDGSYEVISSKSGKLWHELQVTEPELFWSKTKVMVLAYD